MELLRHEEACQSGAELEGESSIEGATGNYRGTGQNR